MTTEKHQALLRTVSILLGLVATYVSYYYMRDANTNHRALPLTRISGYLSDIVGLLSLDIHEK